MMSRARPSVTSPCGFLVRRPGASLSRYVQRLWAGEETPVSGVVTRERVLPTGVMHLAFRARGEPLRVFAGEAGEAEERFGGPVVGGARSSPYVRVVPRGGASVGAQLTPIGAALLRAPADELAGRHLSLADVWGADERALRGRLEDASSAAERLAVLERALTARIERALPVHAAVEAALHRFAGRPAAAVRDVVAESGLSHRAFITRFRAQVGLAPKEYVRVVRARRTLRALVTAADRSLIDVALDAGFADQAHMTRELKAVMGMTPGQLRRRATAAHHHVPLV